VVTKSVQNSGRLSPMNTVLTQQEHTTEIPTFNWRESTFTTTKQPEDVTFPVLFSWTWNPEQWTPSVLVLSDSSSALITSSSDKPELVTIGQRDTTPKVLNSLIQSSMSSERKLKAVIASKVSRSPTHWEVVPDPVWELS
jgi:hypothetical protein